MKSIPKLIRRFFGVLMFSLFLMVFLNLALLIIFSYKQIGNGGAWTCADTVSFSLTASSDHQYILSQDGMDALRQKNAWAILIDNQDMKVVWHSENLPSDIPLQYDLGWISLLTRGYLNDYPTATSEHTDGLIVLGFPKKSYWKLMWNTFDYQMIAHMPQTILIFLFLNLLLLLIIYLTVTFRLLRSVRPIVDGVERLPGDEEVYVKEKGLFSGIAQAINKTAEKLKHQEYELKKQEQARANWISGVSHDIRTPLSMVMGYAGQLETSPFLSPEDQKKAAVIRQQSMRMKNLINDLNLASKLEYNMQPLNLIPINLTGLIRQTIVDFLNMDLDGKYPIELLTDDSISVCMVTGDKSLLKRAVSNLIINAQVHNPKGCRIFICINLLKDSCSVSVEDDGEGISDEQLERLVKTPHYMMCGNSTSDQRHGLGLMIVRQIAEVHGGSLDLMHSTHGGFCAVIYLPLISAE
ncbi:sensor histidine kinase [Murimonas intestini]|uniref:sensor histidine kinase n=1 Tax=Murimonas intestini TaxID=1337051 RepID=UPI0011DC99D1|nr:HAMP domain-containing sensor histidine kinase [Murimonas intestini]